MRSLTLFCVALFCCQTLFGQVDVLTQHNNPQRTGWNPQETQLNIANIKPGFFGKLYTYPVDDQVYAQPLIVSGVNIAGGAHNLIIIATVNNTVYAFDADNAPSPGSFWTQPLTHSGSRPPAYTDFAAATLCAPIYRDFSEKIGIVGTPVIDKATGTIYLVSRDVTTDGTNTFRQWLHALDIVTGNEKFNGPAPISGQVTGTGAGSAGGIYAATGNGGLSTDVGPNPVNQASSLLRFTPGLTVSDWFSPKNYADLNLNDLDF